jgi:hypothetical protein
LQRTLIVIGVTLVLLGVLWPWLHRLPFGRLPGDIVIDRGNFRLYFPIATMVLVSAIVSLVLWLFGKLR